MPAYVPALAPISMELRLSTLWEGRRSKGACAPDIETHVACEISVSPSNSRPHDLMLCYANDGVSTEFPASFQYMSSGPGTSFESKYVQCCHECDYLPLQHHRSRPIGGTVVIHSASPRIPCPPNARAGHAKSTARKYPGSYRCPLKRMQETNHKQNAFYCSFFAATVSGAP